MENSQLLEETTKTLCKTQRFAVLATARDNQPHTSLMSFVATPDLRHILIATDRKTRKYAYLTANANVSLLIDNCTNRGEDITEAVTITVTGVAEEVEGETRAQLAECFLARHPYMADFIHSPSCALVRVRVATYHIVTQFENVQVYEPASNG